MKLMKTVTFSQFGSAEVLSLVEQPIPQPNEKQVLIKVHTAALNPIDYKIREGSSFVAKKLKDHLPSSLGFEFAGEIVTVGENVKTLKTGDEVLGLAGFLKKPCCYAEYVCAMPETMILKPKKLSFAEATCLPIAGLTALQALQLAKVKSGQTVLIHAGAGGVGHIAIQLASSSGATVFTTASEHNHDFLYALGADQCIDYHQKNFVNVLDRVDVIIDLVGGEVGIQSLEVLSLSGCMITVPTITAEQVIAAAKQKHLNVIGMIEKPNMKELTYLADLASNGKLKVEISHLFKLSEAKSAHEILESGHTRGKLVFKII